MVGGGNTAVEDALYLTRHAQQGDGRPPARQVPGREDHAGPAVRQSEGRRSSGTRWSTRSLATERPRKVVGVQLRDVRTDAVSRLSTDGVFVAIGHVPRHRRLPGPCADGFRRLYHHRAPTRPPRPFRASSRPATSRTSLPASRDSRRHGLHGGARGREIPRGARGITGGAHGGGADRADDRRLRLKI